MPVKLLPCFQFVPLFWRLFEWRFVCWLSEVPRVSCCLSRTICRAHRADAFTVTADTLLLWVDSGWGAEVRRSLGTDGPKLEMMLRRFDLTVDLEYAL